MITAFVQPSPTWNVISDARQLFDYPFMVHALVAGTIVAIVAAPVGWVMVLRRETFAGSSTDTPRSRLTCSISRSRMADLTRGCRTGRGS